MITYSHKGALYVNMTNLCTNKCTFCLRSKTNGIFEELWYNGREPTREEILAAIIEEQTKRVALIQTFKEMIVEDHLSYIEEE